MIDGAGKNHFVTHMIWVYELGCILENRYLTYIFPREGGGGTAIYAIYVHLSATVKGMVFKQLAYSRIGYINQRVSVLL